MTVRTISLIFLSCLVNVSRVFGAAPDRIDGLVYYEAGGDIAHISYDFANVLSANGTFSQLYNRSQPSSQPANTHDPIDGTYVYRKLDDTTAELTFTPSSRGQSSTRTLNFRSDNEGSIQPQSVYLGVNFRFAPLSSATSVLVNCSNGSFLNPGKSAFTGFVVTGGTGLTSRTVLIRAVGPGLGIFGITDFLRNPAVSVIRASDNFQVGSNDVGRQRALLPSAAPACRLAPFRSRPDRKTPLSSSISRSARTSRRFRRPMERTPGRP